MNESDESKINLLPRYQREDISSPSHDLSASRWELQKINPTRNPASRILLCAVVVLSTLLVGMSIIFATFVRHSNRITPSANWKHCGNSSTEALGNNCILDFIAGAWVPTACYNEELEREFLGLKGWQWFRDEEGQSEISVEEIRETGGPDPIYVSLEYHWIHCSYTWKKLHRAKTLQTTLDTHIGSYEHTVHCADGLVARIPSS